MHSATESNSIWVWKLFFHFAFRASFLCFFFNIRCMNQISTINPNIFQQWQTVGPRGSSEFLLIFCLSSRMNFKKKKKKGEGWKRWRTFREIFLSLLFLVKLRRVEPNCVKKAQRNDDLCKGQVEVEDISPPGGMFQREANTNMLAHSLRCCVTAVSDSDTYRLSCFWIPVGRLPFTSADIFGASQAPLGLNHTKRWARFYGPITGSSVRVVGVTGVGYSYLISSSVAISLHQGQCKQGHSKSQHVNLRD